MAGISSIEVRNSKVSSYAPKSIELFPNSGVYKIGVDLYNDFKYYSGQIINLLRDKEILIGDLVDESEPCDLVIQYSGMTYTVSLGYGTSAGVVAEAITKDGKIMIYRDREVINFSADMMVDSSKLEKFAKSNKPELQNLCFEGRDIFWDGFNRITFFDIQNYWNSEVILNEEQVEEANKIFPRLFDKSVFKVLRNGSYYGSPSKKVIFQYNQGGSGYQNLLTLYKLWSDTVDRGETLFVKHWDTSLHPLLKDAVLDILEKKSNRSNGTLYLATYRDED